MSQLRQIGCIERVFYEVFVFCANHDTVVVFKIILTLFWSLKKRYVRRTNASRSKLCLPGFSGRTIKIRQYLYVNYEYMVVF